jgi:hypothetical protein
MGASARTVGVCGSNAAMRRAACAWVDWLLLDHCWCSTSGTHTWQRTSLTSSDAGCSNPPKAHHEFHPMGGKRPWPLSSANAHAANARVSDGAKCIARHNMVALPASEAVPPPTFWPILCTSTVRVPQKGSAFAGSLSQHLLPAADETLGR